MYGISEVTHFIYFPGTSQQLKYIEVAQHAKGGQGQPPKRRGLRAGTKTSQKRITGATADHPEEWSAGTQPHTWCWWFVWRRDDWKQPKTLRAKSLTASWRSAWNVPTQGSSKAKGESHRRKSFWRVSRKTYISWCGCVVKWHGSEKKLWTIGQSSGGQSIHVAIILARHIYLGRLPSTYACHVWMSSLFNVEYKNDANTYNVHLLYNMRWPAPISPQKHIENKCHVWHSSSYYTSHVFVLLVILCPVSADNAYTHRLANNLICARVSAGIPFCFASSRHPTQQACDSSRKHKESTSVDPPHFAGRMNSPYSLNSIF